MFAALEIQTIPGSLITCLIANTGFWMQNVGSAWLMTSLNTSPVMVALTQTAFSLPAFFDLPAGVLADPLDKRKLLLLIHGRAFLSAC
ncbi:MFS transporter [Pseudomonas ogarae]|uniref:MFS transporter n=1 Tax=Pseudomonas ogarae (strain DSM 112162 / CECT 30235 / F113) TaxID=1114970 RepID=UPI0013791652|nr:MFS transporter [Pseudomonas ogarae]